MDIIRVNGIVFDKTSGIYRRVPSKTDESLRFFVLHSAFRKWGFVDWATEQGDNFLWAAIIYNVHDVLTFSAVLMLIVGECTATYIANRKPRRS